LRTSFQATIVELPNFVSIISGEDQFSEGEYDVSVTWVEDKSSSDGSLFGEPAEEGPVSVAAAGCAFLRGDADNDGFVSALADAIYLLKWAFVDGDELY